MEFHFSTRAKYLINTAAVILLYFLLNFLVNGGVLTRYQANMLIPVGIYIILAASLNLTTGFLGQLPLGHAGFMSVGAYSAALFTKGVDLPISISFPLGLLVGGLVAAVFGVLIGLPALRLRGDYLAIITLGFAEIIRVIILNLNFTGGAFGLRGIPRATDFTSVFICVVITLAVLHTIIKSRHGRAMISIRENEIAAEACGIPTTYYKTLAFTISAFFAGIAGGLYAHYIGILDATTFGFMKSIEILVMVVLGGMGSMIGSVIAATGLTLLPELLRGFESYRMVIYSLLLVVVMVFKPSGLMGTYDFSLSRSIEHIINRVRGVRVKKEVSSHDSNS